MMTRVTESRRSSIQTEVLPIEYSETWCILVSGRERIWAPKFFEETQVGLSAKTPLVESKIQSSMLSSWVTRCCSVDSRRG